MSGVRIALFISLGINLFIAGLWFGDAWHRPPMMLPQGPNGSFLTNMARDRLSAETLQDIGPSLNAIDATFRAGFDARSAIFAELRDAVSADPYDVARVDALFADLVNTRTKTETEQWRQVGETLGRLSASERLILADLFFPLPPDRQFPPRMPPGPDSGGPPQ